MRYASLTCCLALIACDAPIVERAEGDREPRTAACDPLEPARCLLPWPSNAYTIADPSTATGLRLSVDVQPQNRRDHGTSLSLADGFSRVGTLFAYFAAPLDDATAHDAVHLVLAQHDHPERGREEPLRVETQSLDDGQTILIAHPERPLAANADYYVVVTDALHSADGTPAVATRPVQVAVGLAAPSTIEERAIAGYHAPLRHLLDEQGLDPEHVVRAWDFTTRSEPDPRRVLQLVRDASVAAVDGAATIAIDSLETSTDPAIAAIVYGRVQGLPEYLDGTAGFHMDEHGDPMQLGTRDAPFRVLVPAGTGDYRFVMYGHGTGGNERDDLFDHDLAALGIAKVNVRFYGWTDDEVPVTFINLQKVIDGSFAAAADLVEALGHAAAIQHAMEGPLGEALRAPMLASMPNPAAGRGPDASATRMWVGGSLGGTTGLIYGAMEPSIHHAIINVPGAAWAQWVWPSYSFELIHSLLSRGYHDELDLRVALGMAQTNLDMADGASWVDVLAQRPVAYLVQESIGDPIVPKPGTDIAAIVAGARQVGAVLVPIDGITTTDQVIEASGITQFHTADTDVYDVHGFAARDRPAGVAAREQILDFLTTAFEDHSRIAPPPSCPGGNCDFSGM